MNSKTSAYLSIYNDWDVLAPALKSMVGRVDELVVVDGAYEWMAPFLMQTGRDPAKSDARVYDAIASCCIPARIIAKTWKNEIKKRLAGYAACEGRYIYRIDADEIMFFDDAALERFFTEGAAVAEMDVPTLVTPGWMIAGTPIGRAGLLFDRKQIETDIHANYLWLILTSETRPQAGQRPFPVFREPIAFSAHLTEWRTWETSVNRAAFYHLNYMRGYGISYGPEPKPGPSDDLKPLFDIVPAPIYMDTLYNDQIVTGNLAIPEGLRLLPVPLTIEQQETYSFVYDRFLSGCAELARKLTTGERHFLAGHIVTLDLSSDEAKSAILREGKITIETSSPIVVAKANMNILFSIEPWQLREDLQFEFADNRLTIILPMRTEPSIPILRQNLQFQMWVKDSNLVQKFKVVV